MCGASRQAAAVSSPSSQIAPKISAARPAARREHEGTAALDRAEEAYGLGGECAAEVQPHGAIKGLLRRRKVVHSPAEDRHVGKTKVIDACSSSLA